MNTLTEFDFKHMASMDCPGVRQLYLSIYFDIWDKNRLEDEQAENTKAWIEKKFPEAGEISLWYAMLDYLEYRKSVMLGFYNLLGRRLLLYVPRLPRSLS